MKFFRDEKGQMLIMTSLALVGLMGFAGLATDVGVLFRAQRELQTAADAAATAGAMDLYYGLSDATAAADAKTAAINNGWTGATLAQNTTAPASTTVLAAPVVTVNTPPLSGYHTGSGYVEVIVAESNPTLFMKMFGFSTSNVYARAVAGTPGFSPNCIYLDGPTGTDLDMRGSGQIDTTSGNTGCSMYVASSSSDALKITGGAATANVASLNVVGTGSGDPLPNGGVVNYSAPPESNPFGTTVTDDAPIPSSTTCSQTIGGTSYSLTQSFTSGSVICFTGTNVDISGANITGDAPDGVTLVFEAGVVAADHAATTITNGTLDVYNGTFDQSTNSNLNIIAPTAGWANAIAILIPTSNTTYTQTNCSSNPNDSAEIIMQFGSSNETLEGYIYAPNATVTLHDQGGGVTASGLVAAELCDLSSTFTIPSYSAANPYTTPLRVVSLVE